MFRWIILFFIIAIIPGGCTLMLSWKLFWAKEGKLQAPLSSRSTSPSPGQTENQTSVESVNKEAKRGIKFNQEKESDKESFTLTLREEALMQSNSTLPLSSSLEETEDLEEEGTENLLENALSADKRANQAEEFNPEYDGKVFALAREYVAKQDYQNAIQEFRKVVDAHPNSETEVRGLGLIAATCFDRKDPAQAIQRQGVLRELVEKYPQHPIAQDAQLEIALIYSRAGEYTSAITEFQRFVEMFPFHKLTPRAVFLEAKSYQKMQEYEQAIELYRLVRAEYPQDIHAQWALEEIKKCGG